jgi:hypothetical protein
VNCLKPQHHELEKQVRRQINQIFKLFNTEWCPISQNGHGNSKGFPDNIAYTQDGTHFVVELKSITGKLTPAQKIWRDKLLARKQHYFLFRGDKESLDQLIPFLESHM